MKQVAPDPEVLTGLVAGLVYFPGWEFELRDMVRDIEPVSEGLTLNITVTAPDSYRMDRMTRVRHSFAVPPATYDERSWRRWLLERILDVHRHEACEGFTVNGIKPYAPSHGPGNDPYMIREIGTEEDQRMAFTGELLDTPAVMPAIHEAGCDGGHEPGRCLPARAG